MPETRITFHQQLDEIHRDLVRLAAHVTELIPRGTQVLLSRDLRAAQEIIDGDDELDALSLEIEDRCFHVLALQQPMASDLRAMVTAIRLTSEIERSADLVVNIAKGARRLHGVELPGRLNAFIGAMGDEATKLFRLAIDAYDEGEAGLGTALDDLDDRLDELHREFIAALIAREEELDLQVAVQLALIGRYYERIGDHAVNIGERVGYMVTGWLPEHSGAARHRARVAAEEAPAAEEPAPQDEGEQ